MKKILALLTLILSSIPASAAPTDEQAYVCINSRGSPYYVIIATDSPVTALRASSTSKRILKLKKYAVVAKGYQGEGAYYVLTADEFRLEPLDSMNYTFRDFTHRRVLTCSAERTVYPNPALTISN